MGKSNLLRSKLGGGPHSHTTFNLFSVGGLVNEKKTCQDTRETSETRGHDVTMGRRNTTDVLGYRPINI